MSARARHRIPRRCVALVVACALASAATLGADEKQQQDARLVYARGKQAFQQEHYQDAYDAFRQAYLLSQVPALLYNMASALQALGRPHEAAESLRAYLRAVKDDPDQSIIDARILALEESQRLLDAEARRHATPGLLELPPAPLGKYWTKKRTAAVVLSTVAAALAVGLGVGLGITLAGPSYTDSTLHAHRATP